MPHTEDLITLLKVAGRAVRVDEAAAALSIDAEEVLAAIEELVDANHVLDTAEGVTATENTPEPKSASRTSYLAGKWAEALDGVSGDPTEVGLAYLAASQYEKAAEKLVPVALGEGTSAAVDGALAAGEHGSFYSRVTEGQLHLSRAAHKRDAGDTLGAREDLDIAIRRLEGSLLVDALGLAASVSSDLQHPQKAETLAALGAWQAFQIDDPAKQGSLLSLNGRELSRVGFPSEGDRAIEIGRSLVEKHGNLFQKDLAHWHAAWVMQDRGEARNAEAEFARLRDHAQDGDPVILATREAYWARALFAGGQAKEAQEAATRAEDLADQTGADAPRFIAGLARMEGALNFARYEEAAEHAEAVLEVIRRSLPQWENVALVGLARAYAGMGEVDRAHETLDRAVGATPEGIDGWRWRLHAQEIRVSLTPESEAWPQKEAEDLTDALLQARFFDAAAHLMCIRSHREKDRDLGLEAAALATQLGNPMLASRAAESAEIWDDPVAVPVARGLRRVEQHVPDEWLEEWRALDSVSHAFAVDTEVDVDSDELTSHIDDALQAAGLAGTDVILSPAQRQAKGLVRRRPRRRLGTGALVGVGAGAVVISVALAFFLFSIVNPPTTTIAADPTTTTIPRMEDTVVELPERGIFGTVEYRGGAARTGVMEDGGFLEAVGNYFAVVPGGSFQLDAMAYGRYLIVAGDTPGAELVLVNMGSDEANKGTWINVGTDSELSAPPAVKTVQQEGAAAVPLMILSTEDGRLHGRNALIGTSIWRQDVGGVVRGTPLFVERPDGVQILVGTDQGVVFSFDIDGNELWRYEGSEQNPLAAIDRPLAYHDNFVYLVDSEGVLHVLEIPEVEIDDTGGNGGLIDPSGGEFGSSDEETETDEPLEAAPIEFVCDHRYGSLAFGTAPIISGGVVYIPVATGSIFMTQPGSCFRQPSDRVVPQVETFTQFGIQFPPIIRDDIIYMVDNTRILAIDSIRSEVLQGVFNAESPITGAPVMAGGVIYVGTQSGEVFAVDPETREAIWSFGIGESIFGSIVPVKGGAVFALTAEGTVVAIAVR